MKKVLDSSNPENVDLNESFVEAFDDSNIDNATSSVTKCLTADVTARRLIPKISSEIYNFSKK